MHKCKKNPCPAPATCKCRTVRESQVPIIWLLGGPGSGKRTLGTAVAATNDFQYLSTGQMLRDEAASGSTTGQEFEKIMLEGKLLPDEPLIQLMERKMVKAIRVAKQGYLVNFAKNVTQAELFERFISPVDLIVYLDCSDKTMKERLLKRAEELGASTDEEAEEQIRLRIETFRETIEPLLEFKPDCLKSINAEGTVEEVTNTLQSMIEEVAAHKLATTVAPSCDDGVSAASARSSSRTLEEQ